jgi:hypothetical protein
MNDWYIPGQALTVTGGENTKIPKPRNYAEAVNDPVYKRI